MKTTSATPRAERLWPSIWPRFQQTEAWCGPAVVQAKLAERGICECQEQLSLLLGTTFAHGTQSKRLRDLIQYYDLGAQITWAGLDDSLARGQTPIIACRCYGWSHYMIALSSSNRYYYFMDPASETGYGRIKRDEFYHRWTDRWCIEVSGADRGWDCTYPDIPAN